MYISRFKDFWIQQITLVDTRHRLNTNTNFLFVFPANSNWKQNNNKKGLKKRLQVDLTQFHSKSGLKGYKYIYFFFFNLRQFLIQFSGTFLAISRCIPSPKSEIDLVSETEVKVKFQFSQLLSMALLLFVFHLEFEKV